MLINISAADLNQSPDLMQQLELRGLQNPKPIGSENAKIVKIFCSSAENRENLIRINELCVKYKNEIKTLKIEPCISICQCFKCNIYGHTEDLCPQSSIKCSNCNSSTHTLENCKAKAEEIKCVNCGQNHNAYDKNCSAYKELKANSIEKEKAKILKMPTEKILKETWANIASYEPQLSAYSASVEKIIEERKDDAKSNSELVKKVEDLTKTSSETLSVATKLLETVSQQINSVAEQKCVYYYAKATNETNDKFNQIQQHIGHLFRTLLPNTLYSPINFQNIIVSHSEQPQNQSHNINQNVSNSISANNNYSQNPATNPNTNL